MLSLAGVLVLEQVPAPTPGQGEPALEGSLRRGRTVEGCQTVASGSRNRQRAALPRRPETVPQVGRPAVSGLELEVGLRAVVAEAAWALFLIPVGLGLVALPLLPPLRPLQFQPRSPPVLEAGVQCLSDPWFPLPLPPRNRSLRQSCFRFHRQCLPEELGAWWGPNALRLGALWWEAIPALPAEVPSVEQMQRASEP